MIVESLLKILVCPKCGGPLNQVGQELICEKEQLAYPIEKDIPILLSESAVKLKNK